eukprot:CAMPEP_0172330350 /NCGR_PEP_ID=MMETSP1058-20130122/61355_1 /TAXON_ID=83371 /ORGANISM="Detonula confervacea, Strain CCMP 353" /LENGTH=369 /DNA_ID=CAMNT_0013047557 /DNA_START=395 /DNA_END=1504 /DNA_ORIENTATION=-
MHSNLALTLGARVPLSSEQAHYLTNVMRILKKRKNNRQQQQSSAKDSDDDVTTGRDCIRIFNGKHGEWLAKVHESPQQQSESSISGKGRSRKRGRQSEEISLVAECILQLRTQDYNEDERPWILFVPLKKQPRMKIMIEKCTELGVGRLIPVASDRMEGGASLALLGPNTNEGNPDIPDVGLDNQRENHSSNIRFDKLQIQTMEASEQCERLDIPMITNDACLTQRESSQNKLWEIQDILKQWCCDWEESQHLNEDRDVDNSGDRLEHSGARVLLICRERGAGGYANGGKARVVPVLQALHDNRQVSFLVGPEGGWSAEEEIMFDEICVKYDGKDSAPVQCVSLGSSVLRAETASMMAVGAWALVNDSQ